MAAIVSIACKRVAATVRRRFAAQKRVRVRPCLHTFTLAMQTQGATLPVTFKFGTDSVPVYHAFATLSALANIQSVLARAWSAKDAIAPTVYTTI